MNFKEYIAIQEAAFPWRQTLSRVPGLSLFKQPEEPVDPVDIKDIAPKYKGSLQLMLQQGNLDAYVKALLDILSRKPDGEEWVQRYQGMPEEEKEELRNKLAAYPSRKKSSYGIEPPSKRKRSPRAEKSVWVMRPGTEKDIRVNDLIHNVIATLPQSERHQKAIRREMGGLSTQEDKTVLQHKRLEAIKSLRDGSTSDEEEDFWRGMHIDLVRGLGV